MLKLLKDYGYKVDAHWMPDLQEVLKEKDFMRLSMVKIINLTMENLSYDGCSLD